MDAGRKEIIKQTILRIHAGEDVEALKAEFGAAVKDLTEAEIASVEEEAMREGASVDDVRKLCGAHLEVFKASMAGDASGVGKPLDVPHWHPLHIQEEEHIDLANKVALLKTQVHALLHGAEGQARAAAVERLAEIVGYLGRAESNFLKQENVFFPTLERHGIAQPPKVMWAEHDLLRALQKRLAGFAAALSGAAGGATVGLAAAGADLGALRDTVLEYEGLLLEHVMKERSILFPASLQLFTEKEWADVRREFDEIGYFAFYPMPLEFTGAAISDRDERSSSGEGRSPSPGAGGALASGYGAGAVNLDTGYLSRDELAAMLKSLPVDITFVDAEDKVKYFSETPDRIFVRTKAIIGRSVQNCHPPKSVHVVTKILDDFRSGAKTSESFWLHLGPKLVYIRYFAVHGDDGAYLGALEVSQDIAPIQAIEGEKRLAG